MDSLKVKDPEYGEATSAKYSSVAIMVTRLLRFNQVGRVQSGVVLYSGKEVFTLSPNNIQLYALPKCAL